MATIDISGLDKVNVIIALFNGAKFVAPAYTSYNPRSTTQPSRSEIEDILNHRDGYIDYLRGVSFKTSFATDNINPWGYDRDHGDGSMKKIIDELRRNS